MERQCGPTWVAVVALSPTASGPAVRIDELARLPVDVRRCARVERLSIHFQQIQR